MKTLSKFSNLGQIYVKITMLHRPQMKKIGKNNIWLKMTKNPHILIFFFAKHTAMSAKLTLIMPKNKIKTTQKSLKASNYRRN